MNVRPTLSLLLAATLAVSTAAAPALAQMGGLKAAALPEGTEPYGPVSLLAKEESVPVRTDPGFVFREIRFLRKGQEVIVDGRKGTWLHVRPQGWVLQEHLVTQEQFDAPAPVEPQDMVAVREGIRVRASPSTDAEITRTLKADEAVEVLGQEAGWWKLTSGGYVAGALLRPADADASSAMAPGLPASGPSPWVVSAPSANVRSEPGADAPIIRKVERGEIVSVASIQNDWAEVPGGWIRADLLQPPAPRSAAPAPLGPGRREALQPGAGARRWSLVDLNGVVFEVIDISRSGMLPGIKKELRATGVLEEDWTYLGLTIGVPPDGQYRFNYAPDRNSTIIEDVDGQRFGNVYVVGPFERLPIHVRQFFVATTVGQGEKYDGILLFKPSLKPENIKQISMFIGGRLQRFYEDTSR